MTDDIKQLLIDMKETEQMMFDLYSRLASHVKDDRLKNEIMSIIKDESKHFQDAERMLSILEE